VSAAGGLLSLSSSVGDTGVSSSIESAFVPDVSGAVTVRSGVAVSSSSGSLSGSRRE